MTQSRKSSNQRGKPSYFMAILGVTIVLLFVGIFGWLILNASRYTEKLKENIEVQVYLRSNATQSEIDSLKRYIAIQPYTIRVEYLDKEAAMRKWNASGEENFSPILGNENPLPASINFNLKSTYVVNDSLEKIKTSLLQREVVVQSVNYPAQLVEKMGPVLKWILGILVIISAVFLIASIVLIDNTIKLAMYSNRFLIKTMQMVGATRNFITRPIDLRAVINGAISATIAIALLLSAIILTEKFFPEVKDLRDNVRLLFLFLLIIILGIGITVFSTHRSVIKYLKMKLDDLY
ncbi:MAG TPA: permease-like cell division protein FtsX [Chitinophagaceae bacterium]|nr:permease-like cell division protein FtsX [Chitinophagaceae bacterium]